jgi:hypothetical protein
MASSDRSSTIMLTAGGNSYFPDLPCQFPHEIHFNPLFHCSSTTATPSSALASASFSSPTAEQYRRLTFTLAIHPYLLDHHSSLLFAPVFPPPLSRSFPPLLPRLRALRAGPTGACASKVLHDNRTQAREGPPGCCDSPGPFRSRQRSRRRCR